jgi:hypothetical protein
MSVLSVYVPSLAKKCANAVARWLEPLAAVEKVMTLQHRDCTL